MTQAISGQAAQRLAYAVELQAKKAARQKAEDRKTRVGSEASKALANTALTGSETAKAQARARVQAIVERLKILKKLFGADPRAMAHALTQIFKELKSALKAYRDAAGQELSMSGLAVGATLGAAPAESGADAAADAAGGADPAAKDGASLYEAVAGEVDKRIGEDGLDFIKQVRGLSNDLAKLLETARTQARGRAKDDKTDNEIKGADEALSDLRDDLSAFERDIHQQIPTAGLKLSVAA